MCKINESKNYLSVNRVLNVLSLNFINMDDLEKESSVIKPESTAKSIKQFNHRLMNSCYSLQGNWKRTHPEAVCKSIILILKKRYTKSLPHTHSVQCKNFLGSN